MTTFFCIFLPTRVLNLIHVFVDVRTLNINLKASHKYSSICSNIFLFRHQFFNFLDPSLKNEWVSLWEKSDVINGCSLRKDVHGLTLIFLCKTFWEKNTISVVQWISRLTDSTVDCKDIICHPIKTWNGSQNRFLILDHFFPGGLNLPNTIKSIFSLDG